MLRTPSTGATLLISFAAAVQTTRFVKVEGWTFWRGTVDGYPVPVYRAQPTGKTGERFKVACGCQPPRSFWIRAKQYTPGPITCGVCGQDFQP